MLGFFNKEKLAIQDVILVVSKDEAKLKTISEQLAIKGFSIKVIKKNLSELKASDFSAELKGIVLELGCVSEHLALIADITKLLISDIPCICLANNDSIVIYQDFLKAGLCYLHYETQIHSLHNYVADFKSKGLKSLVISTMGCKGGVGSSLIAYFISKLIYEKFKTKVLLVQGASSSQNIDLLANIKFESDLVETKELSYFKENKEAAYNLKESKYNFCVYDSSIQASTKEEIEGILNQSDTVILIINNELAALRKAKDVQLINEFLLSVNQGCKNLLILLNESNAQKHLNKEQIEELLEHKIDIVVPYFKSAQINPKISNKNSKLLNNLLLKIFNRVKK